MIYMQNMLFRLNCKLVYCFIVLLFWSEHTILQDILITARMRFIFMFTFKRTSIIIEVMPRTESQSLIFKKFLKNFCIASIKESLRPLMPKSVLNCDDAIVMAAALVKPNITGMLMKSIKKPKCNTPIAVIRHPLRKHSRTYWKFKNSLLHEFPKILKSKLWFNTYSTIMTISSDILLNK